MEDQWPPCETIPSVDFVAAAARVFKQNEDTKVITIGGYEVKNEIRELLREQADYLLRSEVYEIFEATLTNEAARLALASGNFEHVQFAKALQYWNATMKKIYVTLSQ